jgi:hypothetical protein
VNGSPSQEQGQQKGHQVGDKRRKETVALTAPFR